MTQRSAAANFDRIAQIYRWMEYATFGRSLQRCRERFLPRLEECEHALVLGDGDGRFAARLLANAPNIHVDAVDSSASMLRLLERRTEATMPEGRRRLRTHHTNALSLSPKCTYDLVATHFFLDCLSQPEVDLLCARIARHIQPRGLWLVSEFRIPAGAMHWPSRFVVRLLYLAFRSLTGLRTSKLPDHASALTAASFTRIAQHLSLGGLLTSELWQRKEYTPAMLPPQLSRTVPIPDPLPDPEPASPSLPGPDPGVYHREPGEPAPENPGKQSSRE